MDLVRRGPGRTKERVLWPTGHLSVPLWLRPLSAQSYPLPSGRQEDTADRAGCWACSSGAVWDVAWLCLTELCSVSVVASEELCVLHRGTITRKPCFLHLWTPERCPLTGRLSGSPDR